MSTTPGRPRLSGIPTPGRLAVPRPRSSAGGYVSDGTGADELRALSEAMKHIDPTKPRATPLVSPVPSDHGFGLPKYHSSRTSTRPSSRASSIADPPHSILRSKTPTNSAFKPRTSTASSTHPSRPESRQSDVRSSSRLGAAPDPPNTEGPNWKVGDPVRINSLGFEGTIRYIGGIEGKQGIFAGVELLPGFRGRGKNDGSVNGIQYFSSPPLTGVFVALRSLSEVSERAPSAASSHGPPVSSGRVTPANLYGTIKAPPITPTARKSIVPPTSLTTTPGSRASKYIGITAKQLTTTRSAAVSPPPSPSFMASTATTPKAPRGGTVTNGSATSGRYGARIPALGTTPKASRPSTGTTQPLPPMPPPNRIPSHPTYPASPSWRSSNIALPPPSPRRQSATPTLSQTSTDTFVDGSEAQAGEFGASKTSAIEFNARGLQEKIDSLRSGTKTPSSPNKSQALLNGGYSSHDGASPPLSSSSPQRIALEKFRAQIKMLEQENDELKAQKIVLETSLSSKDTPTSSDFSSQLPLQDEISRLQAERHSTLEELASVRSQLDNRTKADQEFQSTIDALTASNAALTEQCSKAERASVESHTKMSEVESSLRETEAKLRDAELVATDKDELIKSLKEAVDAKTSMEDNSAAVLNAKDKEIAQLEARLKREVGELMEQNRELLGQVEELRMAGQETISLYEERLSAAETKRYELEDMLITLQTELQTLQSRPLSPTTQARNVSTAAQIENESLKEQIVHFQQKISNLEDSVEDLRVNAERDELAVKQRVLRYKENEAAIRSELDATRRECERLAKAELSARTRVEEVGEALRESDLALENARADIEVYRNEQAATLQAAEGESGAISDKLEETAKKALADRARLMDEISVLKTTLETARAAKREAVETSELSSREVQVANTTIRELTERLTLLQEEKDETERSNQDQVTKLAGERKLVAEMRQALDDRTSELESIRKGSQGAGMNKDLSPTPTRDDRRDSTQSSSSRMSKRSADPSRDENLRDQVTGLKHIVQELQRENSAAKSQIASLQNEKALLQTDVDELREMTRNLEGMLQDSVDKDEEQLRNSETAEPDANPVSDTPGSDSTLGIQDQLKESKAKLEAEVDQLQKKIAELEKENNKTVLALNKDISDLENLVEAKIYREDDLEREIERLKEKLAKHKAASKTNGALTNGLLTGKDETTCEICGHPGHDIVSCEVVFSTNGLPGDERAHSAAATSADSPKDGMVSSDDLWCDECEVLGDHVTTNCPHAMDVF